jgi:hypothetical protein
MASIVTETLKQELVRPLLTNIKNGIDPAFYIGLSRSNPWTGGNDSAPAPRVDISEENRFRRGLQAVIKVNSASYVVPRNDWTSGTFYSQYDDKNILSDYPTANPFYVMNDNNQVFICLQIGRDTTGAKVASTIKPALENLHPFGTSDGYIWKFLYTVSALEANYYMTQNYMPVRYIESVDSNSTGAENKQWAVQNAAHGDQITSFIIEDSGSNYHVDSCDFRINGVYNPFIIRTINAGKISKVSYAADSSTFHFQHNLDGAILTIDDTTGTGAIVRPVLSTSRGFGSNAVTDLKSQMILINSKITGNEPDFITSQDFRQICIIKNIKDSASSNNFTQITGKTLNSMTLSSQAVAISADRDIVGAASGAKAWVDHVVGNTIYYHQFDSTGYVPFVVGDSISEIGGAGEGVILLPKIIGEANPRSGDILYIDNRAAVERVPNQTEDIKIVIKLDNCS